MKSARSLFEEIELKILPVESGDAKNLATELSRATAEFHIAVHGGHETEAQLEAKVKHVITLAYRTYRVSHAHHS